MTVLLAIVVEKHITNKMYNNYKNEYNIKNDYLCYIIMINYWF